MPPARIKKIDSAKAKIKRKEIIEQKDAARKKKKNFKIRIEEKRKKIENITDINMKNELKNDFKFDNDILI
jgi:hypothetical protein